MPNVASGALQGYLATMILLRHGQSEFNVHYTQHRVDPGIEDPKLTPLGHRQAEQAAQALAGEGLQRVLASPYTRALQTAAPIVQQLGIPLAVNPAVRERFAFVCDVGTCRSQLIDAWPEHDFAGIEEVWWPSAEESRDSIVARAGRFRHEMAQRPDWAATLVVSHWGFIMALTGQRLANGAWIRFDPTAPPPAEISWVY